MSAKRSGRRVPLIVLGVIGGVVLLVALAALAFFWRKEVPVTAPDKAVLVTAARFVEYFEDFDVDPSRETFRKVRNIDGSYELEYEYDTEEFYLMCGVGVDRSVSDARTSYLTISAGVLLGTTFTDAEWRDRPELLRWGDESKCALFHVDNEDQPVGNYFACRKGKRTFVVLFAGAWFDEPDAFREFLEPVLQRFERYDP